MANGDTLARVAALFRERLRVDVPSPDMDLFGTGVLDSLQLVELLAALEQTFELQIAVEDLELDDFRTLSGIVQFVVGKAVSLRG